MYKIVIDSCGELPEDLEQDGHFCHVPLELEVDGVRIPDDETFNQKDFLRRVRECIHSPKSSCPSPERYMSAYEGEAENVYVITLSGRLSGSYNSAMLGADLYHEEHQDAKNIHVFNSKSASVGETLIGLKVQDEDGTELGTVKDVIETGANDVYEVEMADGRSLLLPAIKQCILNVDVENGMMQVHVLEGLLDL